MRGWGHTSPQRVPPDTTARHPAPPEPCLKPSWNPLLCCLGNRASLPNESVAGASEVSAGTWRRSSPHSSPLSARPGNQCLSCSWMRRRLPVSLSAAHAQVGNPSVQGRIWGPLHLPCPSDLSLWASCTLDSQAGWGAGETPGCLEAAKDPLVAVSGTPQSDLGSFGDFSVINSLWAQDRAEKAAGTGRKAFAWHAVNPASVPSTTQGTPKITRSDP